MGELIVQMFVTLDGVIQAPGGPEEDEEGAFPHGGWQFPLTDEASFVDIAEGLDRMDALLIGRKTYDIFAGYWPTQSDENPFAGKMNGVPKYVASRTLKKVDWNNSHLIEDDLARAVKKIKAEHEAVTVIGSADLVQSLHRAGLIDQYVLFVYPVVLGAGKRLFPPGADPTRFKLVESRPLPGGAVLMRLAPDGKPTYGTFDLEEQRA